MKKLCKSLLLALFSLAVVCLIQQPAQAASHKDFSLFDYEQKGGQKFTEGDYEYIIIDGEAYITKAKESLDPTNTSYTGHVEIPSQLGGYPVTFLYGGSFRSCVDITEVTIPDTVRTIGFNCFEDCTGLETVNLGANVELFIVRAFAGCSSLKTVNWGDKVQNIGRENFYDCESLTSITIPDSVTTIDHSLFYYCENLESVKLSENLTDLPQSTFHDCYSLKSIVIPDSVQSIGRYAFCMPGKYVGQESKLESVVIGKGVKSIDMHAFDGCVNLTTVEMNDAVKTIEYGAFMNCKKLQSIVIPDTTMTIGERAFYQCESLAEVTLGNSVETIGTCAFEDCAIAELVIPDSVTQIGVQAFYGCGKMASLELGSSVGRIDTRAFAGCGMADIEIPDSVTYLGQEAFSGCNDAKTLRIGNGITELREKAFYNCSSLKNITIDEGVTTIGEQVFTGCADLEKFVVAEANPNFSADDRGVLFNKDKTTLLYAPGAISGSYTVPDGVTIIGAHAFYECKKLERVAFPDSLKTIGDFGFYGCDLLEHVDYGNGVQEAGSFSFGYCHKLTETNLPDSFRTIGPLMYHGCDGLVDIVIPDGVETIGAEAFAYCNNLVSVKLGKSVAEIKKSAFEFTGKLQSITIPASVKTIGSNAFYRTDRLTDVYYGDTYDTWVYLSNRPSAEYIHYSCTEPNGHWKAEGKEATCESAGHTMDCCACGYERNEQEIPAKGHSFGEWKVTKAATCTEKGSERRECENCDKTETRDVIATDHDYKDTVTAPTCTEKGYTTYTCNRCGDTYKDTYVEALGHDGIATKVVAPTYTQDGYTEYVCSRCGYTYKDDHKDMLKLPKLTIKAKTSAKSGKPVVSWTAAEDETISYKVYRATSSKGKYSLKGTVTGNSFEDTSASVGKKYYYKVKAAVPGKTGSYSNYDDATCKLAAPVIKTSVSKSSGKVKVSWGKVSSAKKYYVYRATSKSGSYTKLTTTTKTYYTDSSAKVGTTYYYKVKAVASSSSYNSSYSAILTAKRICAQPDLEAKISTTYGKPSLSWDKVSGAKEYKIYRAESKSGEYTLVKTTTSTSWTDKTAEFDKDYWYRVEVIGSKSGTDNDTEAPVGIHTTCAKPSVSVKLSSKKPKLSWKPVEGATKYYVYRATSKSGKYKKIATVTDATSYRDAKAKKGKTYYYKVKAIAANSEANSAYSSVDKIKSK